MKGLVFTEFIEMVESQMGFETVHEIIENANLPSQGIYTAVGTYPEEEMVSLLVELNRKTNIPIPDLLESFGQYLFERFTKLYSHFLEGKNSTFEFLEKLEDYIHVEVLKLYPDALLPTIDTRSEGTNQMTLSYKSPRKLSALALGLIKGCAKHFGEELSIQQITVKKDGTEVNFILTKE